MVADIFDYYRNRDLASCSYVCRAWAPRSQMHLFSIVQSRAPRGQSSFQYAIRNKPFLLRYIRSIRLSYKKALTSSFNMLSANLLSIYRMENLQQCSIYDLSLETKHLWLPNLTVSMKSVQTLHLIGCKTAVAHQLGRFITSFPSLSTLALYWGPRIQPIDHGVPHLQFNRSNCCLEYLVMEVVPNVSTILGYFIHMPPFVTTLKRILLSWEYVDEHSPIVEISELLLHCSASLEDVTICMKVWFIRYDFVGFSKRVTIHISYHITY